MVIQRIPDIFKLKPKLKTLFNRDEGDKGDKSKANWTLINAEKNDLGLNIKLRFYVLISVHHENQRPNSL